MSIEELHNEAYEYCERRKDEFIRMINYIEIAGPREKRIEELEQENEQLKQQIELYKEMLNRNPCVRIPDWHCNDCLEENKQLKAQIEKMKCCGNCKQSYEENEELRCDVINCLSFDKWELEE